MGTFRLLTSKNGLAFLVCSLVGYALGLLLPPGLAAYIVSMLVSYHLFLAWLLISADRPSGFSLPILHSALTHACCLAVVVGLPFARHAIPYFLFLRFGVTFIAKFESSWLLDAASARSKTKAKAPVFAAAEAVSAMTPAEPALAPKACAPVLAATEAKPEFSEVAQEKPQAFKIGFEATDWKPSDLENQEKEWLNYLSKPMRTHRKPGITLKEEHRLWLAVRARSGGSVVATQGGSGR